MYCLYTVDRLSVSQQEMSSVDRNAIDALDLDLRLKITNFGCQSVS